MIKIAGYLKLIFGLLLFQHSYAQDVSINIQNAASIQLGVSTSILVTVCNEDPNPIDAPVNKLNLQLSVSPNVTIEDITNTDGTALTGWSIVNLTSGNANNVQLTNATTLSNGGCSSFYVTIRGTVAGSSSLLNARLGFEGAQTIGNNIGNDNSDSGISVSDTSPTARKTTANCCLPQGENMDTDLQTNGRLVTVYPNPVKDRLKINGASIDRVELLNTYGKVLKYNGFTSNGIDMGGFPTGIYMIKIVHQDGSFTTRKIIKE
jgi:hypothetical protein